MDRSQRRYLAIGALGAFLFCLGLCATIRSCEIARMGRSAAGMVFLPPGACVATESEIHDALAAVGVTYR